jgi:hypothetical protein
MAMVMNIIQIGFIFLYIFNYMLLVSDDDEFYDRTKRKPSSQLEGESQSIETADTLIDKKDVIMKKMEEKKELLSIEKNKIASETAVKTEVGDALDAFMSGLSSQLGMWF